VAVFQAGAASGEWPCRTLVAMILAVLLTLGVVVWSPVANLVIGDRWYVTRNLVLTGLLVGGALAVGASLGDLGLAAGELADGVRWGRLVVVAVAVAVAFAAALAERVKPLGALLSDQRADLPFPALVQAVLVRIPFGTALFEEVLFRGVLLFALLQIVSVPVAVAWSSIAFGVWHVAPTMVTLRENGIEPVSPAGRRAILGSVAITTVAGVGFSWLVLASGSLLAPILAHWATNALGLLAAAVTRTTERAAADHGTAPRP
jgi:uncharacterized protein